ncbi:HAMP domain-containing protein [Marinobacterium sp. D7]|uniref:sensor histidine kinase n=1 Tax=Marinobacterium ramblicola TaxID=2849041 RepID=UPI001C2D02FD|nr:ATP-binding protein [Marinobacterium ramblicola]MBV1787790.1 HAMP domain-containing protein [Marinobacterium ramblicola]
MKWYSKLFWKIFLVIWLVSAAGTGITVLGVLSVAEQRQSRELLETRARAQASLMLDRLSRGELDEHGRFHDADRHDRRRPLPLWIVDAQSGKVVVGVNDRPPPGPEAVRFELEEGGKHLYVVVPAPREGFYLKRLLAFLLSMQAVLVLLVSALASLLLSWLIVRPINQLRRHARDLYLHQNLSSRAHSRLSRRSDEIGELSREFNQMAGYVEETLTAQQRLLQDVSHELRAPLARLQVAAGLAEQRLGEGDTTAERINRECEQLDGLIAEILSLSRLDQAPVEGEVFAVAQMFDEIRQDLHYTQPERELDTHIEPTDLRLAINGDLLRRALDNLVSNALKYTPMETALTLSARRLADRSIEIRLRDRGEGVSDELLTRLTEPFVRAHQGGDGYGLGLSIAKRAIERLGGSLQLHNHPEGGLECVIRLPEAVRRATART